MRPRLELSLEHNLVGIDRGTTPIADIGRIHPVEHCRSGPEIVLGTKPNGNDGFSGGAIGEDRDPPRSHAVGRALISPDPGDQRVKRIPVYFERRNTYVLGHLCPLLLSRAIVSLRL